MPVDAKPLFRPDVLAARLSGFNPPSLDDARGRLARWAEMISSGRADRMGERELLPSFLADLFVHTLGYLPPPGYQGRYSFSPEKHVEVDGQFADAVLGRFSADAPPKFVVAVEGKGPKDPLDRPHAGRRLSAVEQAYRYATNLPCDWVVVTSVRQTRLYAKACDLQTYERFDTERLATDDVLLRKLVFLLGAERVLPPGGGRCHLHDLREASEKAGREVTKEYYDAYAELRVKVFSLIRDANPAVPPLSVLSATQKLLDRVLFCAFAEDRGLLPEGSIRRAFEHNDPYHPRPVWDNFRGLFRAVDEGREALKIPKYNGGLFAASAENELLDRTLAVPDDACRAFAVLGDYEYRVAADVPLDGSSPKRNTLVDVEVLGHIFEQSITDLERLRTQIEESPDAAPAKLSRRKREGAFYTPSFVTRYIVNRALGDTLADRFERLRSRHEAEAPKTAKPVLADPRAADLSKLKPAGREALTEFWLDWQKELGTVRVLDPSCGSGAFLVECFDFLHAAYQDANQHLADLRGQPELYDLDKKILQSNLYGVDLNEEAVEICRLSLWIKTAQRGKELTALNDTIRQGNSVVSDPAVHPAAFDWAKTFPEVTAAGGFDVVVGNPPYVKQHLLGPFKDHFESRFASYHGMADLYVYFYELGLSLLRPGGRLSFIVTNKWLKTGYGEPLRRHLAEQSWVESLVDFGHAKQIFEDADVFPCILVARKPEPDKRPPKPKVAVIPRDQLRIEDLERQIEGTSSELEPSDLTSAAWQIGADDEGELLRRLSADFAPLHEFVGGEPNAGFATGCNEAFVVDSATRDRLITEHPSSAELLKPYLKGQDLERWHSSWTGDWIIFTRRGTDIDSYPALRSHLTKFREALEPKPDSYKGEDWPGRKGGRYKWFEIQDSVDGWQQFAGAKIIHPDLAWRPQFSLDEAGTFFSKTVYFLPSSDPWVLTVLNSPVGWWYAWRVAQHGKDETLRLFKPFMRSFPIPRPTDAQRAEAEPAVRRLIELTRQRQSATRTVLDWLRLELAVEKPTLRLQSPALLSPDDFAAEVKKSRGGGGGKKKPMTAAEVALLREEHARTLAPLARDAAESLTLEHRLSDLVNTAYGLTPEEVKLMWDTAPPRTPLAPTVGEVESK